MMGRCRRLARRRREGAAAIELDAEVVDERGRGGGASDVDVDDAELTVSIDPKA